MRTFYTLQVFKMDCMKPFLTLIQTLCSTFKFVNLFCMLMMDASS